MPATLEGPRPQQETRLDTPELRASIDHAMDIFRSNEPLPITKHTGEIRDALQKSRIVILDAETGSGKSTAGVVMVTQEMLQRDPNARILVTQPTRLAAAGVANYLRKDEDDGGIGMGNIVGYKFRGAREVSSETRIQYAMEQAVLNEILRNPTLEGVNALFLDEIHLNSTNLTAIMALLKPIMAERERRGDPLWVVLASATMDVEAVKNYYPTAEHIKVEGRTFPVERRFAETPIDQDERTRALAERMVQILTEMDPNNPEDVIGFLPGRAEIDEAYELVKKMLPPDLKIDIYKIMGGEESEESIKAVSEKGENPAAFIMSDAGKTSLTRKGKMRVIDSGLTRTMVYDPATKLYTLVTIQASQDDADQRAGRAGRTEAGIAESLNTEDEYHNSERSLPPEIVRVPPIRQILLLKRHGINIESLDLFAQPGTESMTATLNYLKKLGALNEDGSITEEGKEMADVETDPHFARMIVEARKLGCEEEVTLLVGIMQNPKDSVFRWDRKGGVSFRDKFKRFIEPETSPRSDLVPILRVWNDYIQHPFSSKNDKRSKEERRNWSDANGIRTKVLNDASKMRKEIMRHKNIVDQQIDLNDDNIQKILQSIAVGLLDNIVVKKNGEYQTLEGTKGIQIGNNSVLHGSLPESFITGNIFKPERGEKSYASLNIELTPKQIHDIAPHLNINLSSEEQRAINDASQPEEESHPQQTEIHEQQSSHTEATHHHANTHVGIHTSASHHHETHHTEANHHTEKQSKIKSLLHTVRNKVKTLLKKLKLIR